MKKVKWSLEEAVALYDLCVKNGKLNAVDSRSVTKLSLLFNKRARILQLNIDEKFRNEAGMNMQIRCIQYVVTNGEEGLSKGGKIFYEAHNLYVTDRKKFDAILNEFYQKYDQ